MSSTVVPELTSKSSNSLYEKIRELIVTGKLAPGMRLVERELAQRLGVSRTPIRHVLSRLQQEGYVLAASGGRYNRLMVAPLTKDEAREIYNIVGALDGLVAWNAAQLEAGTRKRLADELKRINDQFGASGNDDPASTQRTFGLHSAFHDTYLRAIHAPRLVSLHGATKPQAARYRRIYSSVTSGEPLERSVEEHEEIIAAIRAGDLAEARRAGTDNWTKAGKRLAGIIEVIGEHGRW